MLLLIALTLAAAETPAAPAAAPDEAAWQIAHTLLGTWTGASRGEPGEGQLELRIEPALQGRFLRFATVSNWRPRPGKPEGERHEDVGYLGRDRRRKTLVLRQFHVEGFVNQYVLESAKPGELVLVSEAIENIAPGWRARETYRLAGDELRTRFELAPPGKELAVYSEAVLKRAAP